jgi:hypothetical protein
MFAMGNYAEQDRRRREGIELGRRWRIADRIPGIGSARMEGVAVWLFCPLCGYRKVAGHEWLFRRLREGDDPMREFTSKLLCVCRVRGQTVPIIAPHGMSALKVNFFSAEGRALLLTDGD